MVKNLKFDQFSRFFDTATKILKKPILPRKHILSQQHTSKVYSSIS